MNYVIAYTFSIAKAKAVSSRTEGKASEVEISKKRVEWYLVQLEKLSLANREIFKAWGTCFPHSIVAEARVISRGCQ